jgi:hypothetical protein
MAEARIRTAVDEGDRECEEAGEKEVEKEGEKWSGVIPKYAASRFHSAQGAKTSPNPLEDDVIVVIIVACIGHSVSLLIDSSTKTESLDWTGTPQAARRDENDQDVPKVAESC